jgi:hypothetical protein
VRKEAECLRFQDNPRNFTSSLKKLTVAELLQRVWREEQKLLEQDWR